MAVNVLLGLQWGDEGKGKAVDFLAPKYNLIARFQGGANAGHTITFGNKSHVLHQIPSGIFQPGVQNMIGNGVVLDPIALQQEVEQLVDFKPLQNLYIAKKAHFILPTHQLLDVAYEQARGQQKIGATLKGIGPAYQDKTARKGLRVGDITHPAFKTRYEGLVAQHQKILANYNVAYDLPYLNKQFFKSIDFLKQFALVDAAYFIDEALANQQKILAEGAQGTLLDIDFGTYPYVTSSGTTAASACTGLGVPPQAIGTVYGIFKAYTTRVGTGPFPTELHDDLGKKLQKTGKEFGATTGRPRRCGWLDLPALKYATMLNGVTQLCIMKVDVLSGLEEIRVCTHYILPNGDTTKKWPFDAISQAIKPVYKNFPGWQQDVRGIQMFEKLPQALLNYLQFIENTLGIPIYLISLGAERSQTIVRNE